MNDPIFKSAVISADPVLHVCGGGAWPIVHWLRKVGGRAGRTRGFSAVTGMYESDPTDLAMRDMEAAIEEAAVCRLRGSQYRQCGFHAYADELLANAKGAEKWLIMAGRVYPARCGADGKRLP